MDDGTLHSSTATATRGLGYTNNGVGGVIVKAALFGDADLECRADSRCAEAVMLMAKRPKRYCRHLI